MAITIAVATPKGGVGKTTTSVNLAAALALDGFRVLIVDIDQQANATDHLGEKDPEVTVEDVLRENIGVNDATYETPVDGLFLLCSTPNLTDYEIELGGVTIGRETKLKKALADIQDALDFIIIDCPPAVGLMTVNALMAADYCLVVAEGEYLSVTSAARVNEVVELVKLETNGAISLLGVLLNKFSGRLNLSKDVEAAFKKLFGAAIFRTRIRKSVKIAEAPAKGLPVQLYAPKHTAVKEYKKLMREVIRRCQKRK